MGTHQQRSPDVLRTPLQSVLPCGIGVCTPWGDMVPLRKTKLRRTFTVVGRGLTKAVWIGCSLTVGHLITGDFMVFFYLYDKWSYVELKSPLEK